MKLLLLSFCVLAGSFGVSRAQDAVSGDSLRKAESAIAGARLALKQKPQDPAPLLTMANAYYDIERWDSAVMFYRAYLTRKPLDTNARVDLSSVLYEADTAGCETSLAQLDSALAINPHMFNALYNYGLLILRDADCKGQLPVDRKERAASHFRSALREARTSHPELIQSIESMLYELEHGQ